MSQFYHKYKNLFLSPPQQPKSYLSGLQAKKLFYSEPKKQKPFHFRHEPINYDMFKEEILPKINRLNKQRQTNQRRVKTQENKVQFNYSMPNPEDFMPKAQKYHTVKKQKSLNDSNIFRNQHLKYKPTLPATMPKKAPQEGQIFRKNFSTVERVPQPQSSIEPSLLPEERGIIFSQFQKINQYAIINQRLNDIKKASRFRPRGFINNYRDAVMKRVEAKNSLNERKIKLKRIFKQEKKEYIDKLPLI